ncbi:MAG: ribonuclease H, partial [Apilactobacillus kunkeei]|nr:ribonuclease H [Apilactobacillus kunkeei]
ILDNGWQNESIDAILDSKYVLDSVTKGWLNSWRRRGWKKSDGSTIKNKNEFMQLSALLSQFKHLNFKWTKGHADNEGNNFVDKLLNDTMDDMKLNHLNKTSVHSTIKKRTEEPKIVEKKERNADMTVKPAESKTAKEYIDKDKSVSDIEKSLRDLGFFDN